MNNVIKVNDFFENLNLDILSKNDRFSVAHWQPEANLFIDGSKLVVPDKLIEDLDYFLSLVKSKNSSLILTPEYSVPWSSLNQIMSDNSIAPSNGKLWVLCMQSTTIDEFNTWKMAHDVATLTKDNLSNHSVFINSTLTENNFLNLAAYVFIHDGKLRVLFQSKQSHMSDNLYEFESDKLSIGYTTYLFHSAYTCFFTLICSDIIQQNILNIIGPAVSGYKNVIVFHPQLNLSASHPSIVTNLEFYTNNNWKFLRLNWSEETSLANFKTVMPNVEASVITKPCSCYSYKSSYKPDEYHSDSTRRKGMFENRKRYTMLNLDKNLTAKWCFPPFQHMLFYNVKLPTPLSNPTTIAHELFIKSILIAVDESKWQEARCPVLGFQELLEETDLYEDLKGNLLRSSLDECSTCDTKQFDKCTLALWNRILALVYGKSDADILAAKLDKFRFSFAVMQGKRFSNENKKHLRVLERLFKELNPIKDDVIIQSLVPDGISFNINNSSPQNSSTFYNISGRENSSHHHKGLAVYTKLMSQPDLESIQKKLSERINSEIINLGVLLFYDNMALDGEMNLFPNEYRGNLADVGISKAPSKTNISPSSII